MRRRQVLGSMAATAAALTVPLRARATARRPGWPPALTMGTASPGGAYAVYGPAWGALAQAASGVTISYRATQGPNENILLIDRGVVALGMTTTGVAREAWDGSAGWTGGAKLRSARALFPMFETVLHGITRTGSGIVSLAGLAGRRVGVGPAGGTAGSYAARLVAALRLSGVTLVNGTIADQADSVADGSLDACLIAAGAPVPAFVAASRKVPLTLLGVSESEATSIRAVLPAFEEVTIPRGTYPGLGVDLPALGMFNVAICRRALADDLVFALTAGVMDHLPQLRAASALAAQTSPANLGRAAALPLHPGAVAYYRARSIPLPAALLEG